MKIKYYQNKNLQFYKEPCLFIATNTCDFKCNIGCQEPVCNYYELACMDDEKIFAFDLCNAFIHNDETKAVVFGGLEPLMSLDYILTFLRLFRENFKCDDVVVIYSGYEKSEVLDKIEQLKSFPNIIMKFGRKLKNQSKKFDELLGVYIDENQYTERIS